MSGHTKRPAVAVLAAASLVAAGALALGPPFGRALAENANDVAATRPPRANEAHARALPDFTAIIKQYGPAVVNVSTIATSPSSDDSMTSGSDLLRRFGLPPFMGPQGDGGQNQPVHGIGSGFIVKSDGLILTNAHVVRGATQVTVKLTDRREFKAKVLGQDKDSDVAVLKIDAAGLPTVRVGDPNEAQVGDWALAIGSPFGFENTATAGIISARARSLPGESYVPFLQTDVPVNPGNSGGPLFDLNGEVIGINSQIYSGSGGYMGISFAIPIDVAMKVEQQLVATGKVTRGRIGVTIQDVNADLAKSFGLSKPQGALVSSIEKGGPASSTDIKPGDVILAVNGQTVDGSSDLPTRIADIPPGQDAKLTVWRGGKEREIDVKVGSTGGEKTASAGNGTGGQGKLGLQVRQLTPDERSQADGSAGVLVEGVSGPAARAGIQPGDVVLAVNGSPVSDVHQFRGLVSGAKGDVALLVQRGGTRIFVPVDLG